jgi:hypothetical protein
MFAGKARSQPRRGAPELRLALVLLASITLGQKALPGTKSLVTKKFKKNITPGYG